MSIIVHCKLRLCMQSKNKYKTVLSFLLFFFTKSIFAIDNGPPNCGPPNNSNDTSVPFVENNWFNSQIELTELKSEGKPVCYMSPEKNLEFIIECYQCCTGEFKEKIKCQNIHNNWKAAIQGRSCSCPQP